MSSVFVLLAGMFAAAPPEPAASLPLRLNPGQEFVYRGLYTERSARVGARTTRKFDLEFHFLVLAAHSGGHDVAILTIQRPERKVTEAEIPPVAKLEVVTVDAQGRMKFSTRRPRPVSVPLEGPPILELTPFLERPANMAGGANWDTTEDDISFVAWNVANLVRLEGQQCLMVTGKQTTNGHRREDRVWLRLEGGFALKVERQFTCGDEFESQMVAYLVSFNPILLTMSELSARRTEVSQALHFADTLHDLMQPRGEPDQVGYDRLLQQISAHVRQRTRTPYREAILDLERTATRARNGERPPEPLIVQTRREAIRADEGQALPDYALTDLSSGETTRLGRMRGKPMVLIFVRPSGRTAPLMMNYVAAARSRYGSDVHLLILATETNLGPLNLTRSSSAMPVWNGAGVMSLFAGAGTPRTVIVDRTGTIRRILEGWGGEYPELIGKELEALLKP